MTAHLREEIVMELMKAAALLSGALVLVSVSAMAQQQPGPGCGPWGMWGGGWYGMFFGPMMMVLFVAAIVIIVVLLVRWLGGTSHGPAMLPPSAKTPLDLLKERFARGEIDKEEYEERRRILEK